MPCASATSDCRRSDAGRAWQWRSRVPRRPGRRPGCAGPGNPTSSVTLGAASISMPARVLELMAHRDGLAGMRRAASTPLLQNSKPALAVRAAAGRVRRTRRPTTSVRVTPRPRRLSRSTRSADACRRAARSPPGIGRFRPLELDEAVLGDAATSPTPEEAVVALRQAGDDAVPFDERGRPGELDADQRDDDADVEVVGDTDVADIASVWDVRVRFAAVACAPRSELRWPLTDDGRDGSEKSVILSYDVDLNVAPTLTCPSPEVSARSPNDGPERGGGAGKQTGGSDPA